MSLTEDGFCARNSGRPDLYPQAPMHYRGPVAARPVAGRLDEVTAPEALPVPQDPAPAVQVPAAVAVTP